MHTLQGETINLMRYSRVNQPTKMASVTRKKQFSSWSFPSPVFSCRSKLLNNHQSQLLMKIMNGETDCDGFDLNEHIQPWGPELFGGRDKNIYIMLQGGISLSMQLFFLQGWTTCVQKLPQIYQQESPEHFSHKVKPHSYISNPNEPIPF